jgi:hypothetical protein
VDMQALFARLGGIRPVVGDKFISMTDAEVEAVEAHLGVGFPEAYRDFLTTYGASAFREYLDYRPFKDFPPELSSSGRGHFSLFYGSEDPAHEGYGLWRRMRFFSGRIPDSLIPIADNGMGDQICLGIRGNEAGKIYLWDLQNEPLDEGAYLTDYGEPRPPEAMFQNIHLIAESFGDFLNRLEVSEDS